MQLICSIVTVGCLMAGIQELSLSTHLQPLPPLRLPALPMRTVPAPSVIPLAHHVRIETYSGEENGIERDEA